MSSWSKKIARSSRASVYISLYLAIPLAKVLNKRMLIIKENADKMTRKTDIENFKRKPY